MKDFHGNILTSDMEIFQKAFHGEIVEDLERWNDMIIIKNGQITVDSQIDVGLNA